MSQIASVDRMLDAIKDPESNYYGGAAAFLFAALHAAEFGRTNTMAVDDLDVELKDVMASGLCGFELDPIVYGAEHPSAVELERWVDQYSYFASRIIGFGQDTQDRRFVYPAICLTEALDTMEVKQAEVEGKPVTDGSIRTAFMDVTDAQRELAEQIWNLPVEIIRDMESRVALCLFSKLLTRRARLRSAPPIDIEYTLSQIDGLLQSSELFGGEDLAELAKLAGTCYRGTKSSVRTDYAFIDRVLTAMARIQK